MAVVRVDDKEFLVILAKDHRDPTLLLAVDEAEKTADALDAAANVVDEILQTSGKLIVPKPATEAWGARVGVFYGGVAVVFDNPGLRVPLPPAVARALAGRIRSAVNAAVSGLAVKIAGHTPVAAFGPRPIAV